MPPPGLLPDAESCPSGRHSGPQPGAGARAGTRALGRAHNAYSRYLNGRLSRSGHLWQNRFYSAPLSRHHLIDALRYVDLNPLRAKLVERAVEYRWSSAAAHLAGHDSSGLLDLSEWSKICPPGEWSGQLAYSNEEERWAERLREATRHGRPWGDESFVRQISELAGRELMPRTARASERESGTASNYEG